MESTSLHLIDRGVVRAYVDAAEGRGDLASVGGLDDQGRQRLVAAAIEGRRRAAAGDEAGANALTYGLGQVLAAVRPSYFQSGVSLTSWEARIDRGIGMLMRPPSRLFMDAGLDVAASRTMPIRLDLSRGMMGGAFIPARLLPDFERILEDRLERSVRRLVDAELDAVAVMGWMLDLAQTARRQEIGLYEAIDVIVPEAPEAMPPGAMVIVPNRKRIEPGLRKRLEAAAKPAKKPGFLARMMGRGARSGNGRVGYSGEESP